MNPWTELHWLTMSLQSEGLSTKKEALSASIWSFSPSSAGADLDEKEWL